MKLFRQECRMNRRSLLIWSLCVGLICFGCLLMYDSMGDTMEEMSGMFAQMGAFSEALGMDKVNIGTLEGFYAVEIAIIFSLGGAMFAAMTGAGMAAKEEEGHTAEFLNTLPLSRTRILLEKYAAMTALLLAFQIICILFVLLGFACMGGSPAAAPFIRYHIACFLMQLELASICFLASAAVRRKPTGAALGLTVLLYMADLLCRVVPALEKVKYVTPFYFANAADIFSEGSIHAGMLAISVLVIVFTLISALAIYNKRDIMA